MIADIDASDIERTSDNTAYFVADPGGDRVLLVRFDDFTLHLGRRDRRGRHRRRRPASTPGRARAS